MKNDIYTMLNEANIDLEAYNKEDFNDIEKKNIKVNFRKSALKKKAGKRNLVAASLFLALTVTFLGTNVGAKALSRVLVLSGVEDIASVLRIEKNLDEYKTVVNTTITDNGITVQLNEVILDRNEMTVSWNITSDKKLQENESWFSFGVVYINGKKANTGAGGGAHNINDYTTQEVLTYDLKNKDYSGDLNVEIRCSTIMLNDAKKEGSWDFKFKANGDELKKDTKEMSLNYKFSLENGEEYTLERYTDNPLGQEIYASTSNFQRGSSYAVDLRGTDDLGNKVEFYASSIGKDGALFKIENIDGNLNENAKILILTPYAAKLPEESGEMDGEFKQVGEAFTIDLSQLK